MKDVSGWFWIDAPSSLPVEVIELCVPVGTDTSNLAVLRGLRVFRLFRLLKLLKLDALLSRLEEALEVNLRNHAEAPTRRRRRVRMLPVLAAPCARRSCARRSLRSAAAICSYLHALTSLPLLEPPWAGVIKLLFLVVKMFFVAHLLACGWFYVASAQVPHILIIGHDLSSPRLSSLTLLCRLLADDHRRSDAR